MSWDYLAVAFRMRTVSADFQPDPKVWLYDHNAHCVLLALCNHADKAGVCYPGRRTLARETLLSLSSVDRGLETLKGFKFISITPPNESRASNTYRVHLKQMQEMVDSFRKDREPTEDDTLEGEGSSHA